jgi:lambda repressor-like predicted transcriptional regulator
MTPAKLRAALKEIGIGTARLARLLGYSPRGARHLLLDRPISRSTEIVIRLLAARRVSIGYVERMLDGLAE